MSASCNVISAAKRTSELIPLCHPLRTSAVSVDLAFEDETTLCITAEAAGVDRTGFEMEALVAASTAALTAPTRASARGTRDAAPTS